MPNNGYQVADFTWYFVSISVSDVLSTVEVEDSWEEIPFKAKTFVIFWIYMEFKYHEPYFYMEGSIQSY